MRHMYLVPLVLGSLCRALPTRCDTAQEECHHEASPPSASLAGIPSLHESAVQARRILQIENIATLSTVFPSASSSGRLPPDVANAPFAMMEYYATCGPRSYDPTILAVTITNTMKNAAAGSNVTLSLRYHLPADAPPNPDPWAYLPANLPRFTLIGHLEQLSVGEVREHNVRDCFIDTHPEAEIWEPGTAIHESWWARLVVKEVYFFGGFGDRARIEWIPLELWQSITQDEIDAYRLVGEVDASAQRHAIADLERSKLRVQELR